MENSNKLRISPVKVPVKKSVLPGIRVWSALGISLVLDFYSPLENERNVLEI